MHPNHNSSSDVNSGEQQAFFACELSVKLCDSRDRAVLLGDGAVRGLDDSQDDSDTRSKSQTAGNSSQVFLMHSAHADAEAGDH